MEFLVHTQIWTAAAKVVESSETGRAGPLDIEDLVQVLNRFADDRDWQQFHSPKNLAMALSVEAAELLEHFQWLTQAESSSPESTIPLELCPSS